MMRLDYDKIPSAKSVVAKQEYGTIIWFVISKISEKLVLEELSWNSLKINNFFT